MGLLSFLKRSSGAAANRKTAAPVEPGDADRARTRARQRLIGAAVLVGLGVVGFPLLFDTQPRPLPVGIPIEIPSKDGAPALSLPKPRAPANAAPVAPKLAAASNAAPMITETAADAGREVSPPASVAQPADKPLSLPVDKPVVAAAKPVERPAEKKPADKATDKTPQAKPTAKEPAKDSARAQALLEGRESGAAATGNGRFVVQVGAFGEVAAAREVRQRVEKLGLKTYTQVVETSAGKRIRVRVGPYGEREEAEKAVAKLKQAGLAPALLTL